MADEISEVLLPVVLLVVVGGTELEALLERDDTVLVAADEVVVEAEDWLLRSGTVVDGSMPGAPALLEIDGTDELIFESSRAQKCSR